MKILKLLFLASFVVLLANCGDLLDLINSSTGNLVGGNLATQVLGQAAFDANGSSTTAATLTNPLGIHFDNTRVLITDAGAHRVVIYNAFPAASGAAANVIVGQTNNTNNTKHATNANVSANGFYFLPGQTHVGTFSDGTRLFVPDTGNHRVLIFNNIPVATGVNNANVAVGQVNLTSDIQNQKRATSPPADDADAASLNHPTAVFVRNNRMYIVDSGNHRILVYNNVPTAHHARADFVIGQGGFNQIGADHGNTFNVNPRRSLSNPTGIWVGGNNLLVADSGNNRVLVFSTNITANDPLAIGVIGQPDFVTTGGATTNATLNNPVSVSSNNQTNAIVADNFNNRVLIWNNIPTNANSAGAATVVLGQPGFTVNRPNNNPPNFRPNNNTLNGPGAVFLNGVHLLIADSINNRVLRFVGR